MKQRELTARLPAIVLVCVVCPWLAFAQSAQTTALRGRVTDQNGAIVQKAIVILSGPAGFQRQTVTDNSGTYSFSGLQFGEYLLSVTAPSLTLPEPIKVRLNSNSIQTLNVELQVVIPEQRVVVDENAAPSVSTDTANNASARVLRGEDLNALSDSPEDLQAELLMLAGPSAGPSGGAIFIDGFSGGQLPSKDAIREIRINQNPFSAEYDRLGLGRIEVLTKPGVGKFAGSVYYNFAHHFWNSRNPYAEQKAPFLLHEYGGNITGPLNNRTSYFLDVRRDHINNGSIVNAITLDPQTLAIVNPFTLTPVTPQRRFGVNPRIDFQLNERNTLTVRYGFTHINIRDIGIGGFNLTSRGLHLKNNSHTFQISETAVLNKNTINETRFQFFRTAGPITANDLSAALQVLGSFNGGGSPVGPSAETRNTFEVQNYTSIISSVHAWRFGVRVREERLKSISPQNFGGTFIFSGSDRVPSLDVNGRPDCLGQPLLVAATSIERYRWTLLMQQNGCSASDIRRLGGGATQFSISTGEPETNVRQLDLGAFVGDDWRVVPNLTLSLGLRYEIQNNIRDRWNFAPRITMAWAPGTGKKRSNPKTVIRAGFGIFYDRFLLTNTLAAERYNGLVQQQFVVTNPDFFPLIPTTGLLAAFQTSQTIQQISPTMRAPYVIQSAVSVERQLPFNSTFAMTYANTHGLHLLRSRDINAPLLGTYDPNVPDSGVFPLSQRGPVFLMESSGLFNQNQLITYVNSRINKDLTLSGSYVLNRARSNTDGVNTFPAKPYDYTGEYGPSSLDIRHRFTLTGSINTKWNVRFSPFVIVESGAPFDITVGRDLYGTTLFNGRPGIARNLSKPDLIQTEYGLLDPNPTLNQPTLSRNFGRGPGAVTVNLRVARVVQFGGEGSGSMAPATGPGIGAPDRRGTPGVFTPGATQPTSSAAARHYNLTIAMSIRNLLNHTNPGPIIGNITSPLFGEANQPAGSGGLGFSESANNRRFEVQLRLTF